VIDDSGDLTVMDMRARCRRLVSQTKRLDLIVVDYLQLMKGTKASSKGDGSREREISEISRGLKSIARELNIPIIALSQLSRAVEAQNPPIPRLSHLRESGSIEQDADVVMFIYREEYYNKESERKNIADLIIAKHRNGPTGQIQLYFDVERASFKNLEKKQDFGPPPPEAI
jgi:replicative DNA helicase